VKPEIKSESANGGGTAPQAGAADVNDAQQTSGLSVFFVQLITGR